MNSIGSADTGSSRRETAGPTIPAVPEPVSAAVAISDAAMRVRGAERCPPRRVAAAIGRVVERWQERGFGPRRETVAAVAAISGIVPELLDESLDALMAPFTRAALDSFSEAIPATDRTFAFLMPGNVMGAGLHEMVAAMLAGAGVIIKPATGEPYFFSNFMRTVGDLDASVAARAAVVNFGREDRAAMGELWARGDGGVIAYGDDSTVASLHEARGGRPFLGFGSRLSGALVATGEADDAATAAAVARDVTLFEQRGCLSPHHVFVVGSVARAHGFAASLAHELRDAAAAFAPLAKLPLGVAAAIRAMRERARWRALGHRGCDGVALWEGEDMGWTVVFDSEAAFSASPGYRSVYVSALGSASELGRRLGAAFGRLEAFSLAAGGDGRVCIERRLAELGVSYVSEPGRMQSPPIDWRHGRGEFFDLLCGGTR